MGVYYNSYRPYYLVGAMIGKSTCSNDIVVKANPVRHNMSDLIKRMYGAINSDIDREELEHSPMVRFKSYGDKIDIEPISHDRLYKGSKVVIGKVPDITIKPYTINTELMLVNGVYE